MGVDDSQLPPQEPLYPDRGGLPPQEPLYPDRGGLPPQEPLLSDGRSGTAGRTPAKPAWPAGQASGSPGEGHATYDDEIPVLARYTPEGRPPRHETEADRRREAQNRILVAAIAAGLSYPRAAKKAKVGLRTVERRMADPAFTARVSRKRSELINPILGEFIGLMERFPAIAERCLESESVTDLIKTMDFLSRQVKGMRTEQDVEARLAALEAEDDDDSGTATEDDDFDIDDEGMD